MTFNELKLAIAIQRANLGGRDLVSDRERLEVACRIYAEWVNYFGEVAFPFNSEDIEKLRLAIRKSDPTKIKVDVAVAHGLTCYFANRGKGPCSDEVECGHIVARSVGGELSVANCQIECRAHNNQRRDMTIEEYLLSPLSTNGQIQHYLRSEVSV